jgi:NADH-quinone oxidoreductase subunit M
MGMPGLAGFWAEFNIFMGMWERFPLVAVLAGISIPITGGYILRAVYQVFFGELKNEEFRRLPKLTWQEYTAAVVLAAVVIGTGLYPAALTEPISASVEPLAAALARAGELGMR